VSRGLQTVVLAIFVLSGAAGLIYEVVWSRQLVLVFGNTTQAVSAILTGFFGGMAIGSFVGGRLADRVRSPLRLYGVIELLLVVVVLATPITFRLLHEVYRGVYPSLEGTPFLALVRFALALLALGPATVLMGATLPSLTRHLMGDGQLSAAFGRLYAANTIGAILGTIAAGLVLIEVLGLTGALVVGAGCSGIAGLVALGLARGRDLDPVVRAPADAPRTPLPKLALSIAFLSGLTSLSYQVLWTKLLASGTGNTTYVFTLILGVFLIGIAGGAIVFSLVRKWIREPVLFLAIAQFGVAVLVVAGLLMVLGRPWEFDPGRPLETINSLWQTVVLVVMPVTLIMGLSFPASSALLPDEVRQAGRSSGSLLAANTFGAILGSFVVPFVLIPLLGSPRSVIVIVGLNLALGIALAIVATDRIPGARRIGIAGGVLAILLAAVWLAPGLLRQPNETIIASHGGILFDSTEDEIASVQAGQIRSTPELWVTGTSMTLLTVDARLMPVLPLIARPESERALIVAFGMGSSFRTSLIAGMRTDAVELVPSVPKMFGFYHPDADAVLADPNGRVIIADGRNHLELTDERFDIIVTDPPPPIESSGASVISSFEYYAAGRDHLTPGGIMMQWMPWGTTIDEYKAHLRTFARVFPEVTVVFGPGGYGSFMLGSQQPIAFPEASIRAVLDRPGVLEDISSAYDSRAHDPDAWVELIGRQTWLSGDAVDAFVGDGPLITDDHPLPEYFLLRRLSEGERRDLARPESLLALTPATP
jgi:spermidine synthase